MRLSVASFCFGCLLVSVMLVAMGRHQRNQSQFLRQAVSSSQRAVTVASVPKAEPAILQNDISNAAPDGETLRQQIVDALSSSDPGAQAMIFTNQFLALISLDPWAAARLAESSGLSEWRTELMRVLAENWAKSDPREAAKWVATLTDSDERDTMLGCLCFHVADPGQAVRILEQQGLNDRREIMLANLVQQWANQDLQVAFAWVANYPPGDIRDDLFKHIALVQSQSTPLQAALTVVDDISSGPVQKEAAFLVLDQWAQQDWNGAAAWAERFPTRELYDQGQTVLENAGKRRKTTDIVPLPMPQ